MRAGPREYVIHFGKFGADVDEDDPFRTEAGDSIPVVEKSAVEKLIKKVEGEIKILEAAGQKGSALGLKIALKEYKGDWKK